MKTQEEKDRYHRDYNGRNRESINAKMRAYYKANAAARRAQSRAFRARYRLGPTIIRSSKYCPKCATEKPIGEFAQSKTNADWHYQMCRSCSAKRAAEWKRKNPERYKANWKRYNAKLPKDTRDRRAYTKKYYHANKAICHERTKAWKKKNQQHFNAYMLRRHKKKIASDPNYAFDYRTRCKIRLLLRGLRKSAPTEKLLGCKISEFRAHLESQWEPWMSWKNYGNRPGCWVIDHIVPVSAFDLRSPEHQRLCFHYTNHRPLCRDKNQQKSDNYDPADLIALKERVLGK